MLKFGFLVILIAIGSCNKPVTIEKIYDDQSDFEGLSYFLPKGIVDLTISRKPVRDKNNAVVGNETKLTIENIAFVPDPEFHYSVQINHSIFYDDKINVSVDANGLLAAINTTVTDKTPDIIRKIAQAPSEILGATPAAKVASYDAGEPILFEIKFSLDPTDPADRYRLQQVLDNNNTGIAFSARPVARLPVMQNGVHPDCNRDPCFRTAMPYALELTTASGSNPAVVSRAIAVLPNKHVVGKVALTRAPFVTKKFDLTFSNGMLTKADLDNPSELLAFVSLPIDVAKAIVSIPSAMLDFKTRHIVADNSLLKAQKESIELQRQIIESQTALLNVGIK